MSIFFCLSGFLITRILLRLPSLSIANIAKFIFRRFMRVWPMMAFQIFLTLALLAAFAPGDVAIYAAALGRLLTFTGGPGKWVGGAPAILWTLQAEFWFYVFYPFVLMVVGTKRTLWVALAGICLSWYFKFGFGHGTPVLGPFAFSVTYLDQLMYGAICACLIENGSDTAKVIFRVRVAAPDAEHSRLQGVRLDLVRRDQRGGPVDGANDPPSVGAASDRGLRAARNDWPRVLLNLPAPSAGAGVFFSACVSCSPRVLRAMRRTYRIFAPDLSIYRVALHFAFEARGSNGRFDPRAKGGGFSRALIRPANCQPSQGNDSQVYDSRCADRLARNDTMSVENWSAIPVIALEQA